MTTFRCLSDILITSWLFTAQWACDCKQSRRDQDVWRTLKLMMGSWRPMWITEGRCWLWGEVTKNHRGGRLWTTDCCWDPAQVWRVVTLPPCRVERATLLGVVQQQIVIVQCPLLQGLPVQISLLISPVLMIPVKVSNQECKMRKDKGQICVVPVFSRWFEDAGNVISAHTNDITARRRQHMHSIRDVAANICHMSMFGMECVADDVETWHCEAVRLVVVDVCLLKANDVNVMDLCQWLYDVTFCCWQPLDVELHDAQSWTYGLKAQVGVIGVVLPGIVTRIHKYLVRRWNLWFPLAGVFAKVLVGRVTGDADYLPPYIQFYTLKLKKGISV